MLEWINTNLSLIIGIFLSIGTIIGWIITCFNKTYKSRKAVEGYIETIDNHTKQISDMDNRHKEDYQKLDSKLDIIINTIKEYQAETKEHNDKLRRATIEQMSSDITSLCECYLERKSIESYELTAVVNQFTVYEEIGGNHGVYELVEKVKLLPVEHKHKSV